MPKYSYACRACGHRFDVQQAFSDDALTTCPQCEGSLRKLYGAVGVVFKGSGFYRTDSRSSGGSSASGSTDSAGGSSPAKEPAAAGSSPGSSSTAGSGSSSSSTAGSTTSS